MKPFVYIALDVHSQAFSPLFHKNATRHPSHAHESHDFATRLTGQPGQTCATRLTGQPGHLSTAIWLSAASPSASHDTMVSCEAEGDAADSQMAVERCPGCPVSRVAQVCPGCPVSLVAKSCDSCACDGWRVAFLWKSGENACEWTSSAIYTKGFTSLGQSC